MPQLVAIDLPGGEAFVAALLRIWDRGDAALPLDQRAPRSHVQDTIAAVGASAVIGPDGERHLESGWETEAGDALVVATSGSTGVPKGVILTHEAVTASAEATTRRLGVDHGDHWLACLPLNHVGGLSVVTRALRSGTPLTVLPRFDPVAVTAAAKTGATLTSLVSTALRRIDSTIFRTIVLGGARAPVDRPPNTVTTYGLTETGSGVVYDGRPLHGVEIRIAGDGEVLVRCPMQLRAYRNAPSPVDADGWLHTGDLGELRADGTLSVQGRRGDLIISGGENIWPDVVEAAIGAHPGVADVGVAGLPDAEWGHLVAAWIVPTTNSQLPNLEDIRSFVADTLPSYMAPRVMFLVDDLQRTSLGKLRRTSLVPPDSTR